MAEVRCIHRGRNKIQYFQDYLVKDPHWRKQTGWEPAPLPEMELSMPEQLPVSQPDELHLKPALKANSDKPKRGRKPKSKQTTA